MPFCCLFFLIVPNTRVNNLFKIFKKVTVLCLKTGKFIKQPCINFLAHTISYTAFIGMIIVSSLKFADDIKHRERFKNHTIYSKYEDLFANYSKNTNLKYRFPNSDFYFRITTPSQLDYAISLWVIGI
jgi:hypothetical protein